MKVLKFDSEEAWLDARRGRIMGTKLKDLVSKRGTKPKIGFYELVAERVAIPPSNEAAMDRGHRLEDVAVQRFRQKTGKKVKNELVIWHRDDDGNIAVSPDGSIGKTEAVEVKCLSSARHLEAWLSKEVPSEYEYQVLQYFIVNDKLKTLYFCFYDPRMPIDFFYLEVKRAAVKEKVDEYLAFERDVLAQIAEIEKQVTF
jgi:predicted phage-related endonuclease